MLSDMENRLRVLLAVALASIVVGGVADLIMDRPASWLSFHVVFEVLLIAGALLLATTLWLGWWRAARSIAGLQARIDSQRAERDLWQASAQQALEGLARAIDDQFDRWHLTPAEREVALLVLKGYGHKQIAAQTGRSERTVRQHAGVVYEKAGLGGRAELAAFFLQDLMLPEREREALSPMQRSTPSRIAGLAIAFAVAALGAEAAEAQIAPHKEPHMQTAAVHIPESIKAEHEEIHARLVAATRAPGRTGEAARALADVLHPHFVREEEIALPPLGLLLPLSRGEAAPDMREAVAMADSLRAELPRMLREHVAIREATHRMGEAARAEGNAEVAALAHDLALHAKSEEEVFYPAAVLVGDLVRARFDMEVSR